MTATTASWRPWSTSLASKGVSGYIGDGSTAGRPCTASIPRDLFRLALEEAPAGSTLHAAADEGVPIRDIAEVIGRHLNLPVVSVAPEDAADHFMWLARFLAPDSPASSALTRELMGWQPTHPGLLDDLDHGHYFVGRPNDPLPLTRTGHAPTGPEVGVGTEGG